MQLRFFVVLALVSLCQAQEHRFFDRANLALLSASALADAADQYTTRRTLDAGGYEQNPLARPFVTHGPVFQGLSGALLFGGEIGLVYLAHQTRHHRWERGILWLALAGSVYGTIHNSR